MKLKNLRLNRSMYGKDEGQLSCTIEVQTNTTFGSSNNMSFTVPEEMAIQILNVMSPIIVQEINRGLDEMRADGEAVLLGKPVEAEAIDAD